MGSQILETAKLGVETGQYTHLLESLQIQDISLNNLQMKLIETRLSGKEQVDLQQPRKWGQICVPRTPLGYPASPESKLSTAGYSRTALLPNGPSAPVPPPQGPCGSIQAFCPVLQATRKAEDSGSPCLPSREVTWPKDSNSAQDPTGQIDSL